jgi:hypothetical protein
MPKNQVFIGMEQDVFGVDRHHAFAQLKEVAIPALRKNIMIH